MRKKLLVLLTALATVISVGLASPAFAATTYFYAIGEQSGIVADGAAVNITVENPNMNSAHDGSNSHSIGELAIVSADSKDSVEVGWRKGATDTSPKLFVFHNVNGVGMGYNLCTDYAPEPFNAGMTIPASMVGTGVGPRFQIVHTNSAWWIAFDLKWVCALPDSIWTSAGRTFTKVEIVKAYGEIAATASATPCADMGNGLASSSGSAARIGSYSLQGQTVGPAAAFWNWTQPSTVGITTTALSTTTFRYGWSGYKANNTLPGNTGSC